MNGGKQEISVGTDVPLTDVNYTVCGPARTAKNAGASSGSHRASTAITSRAYCLVVSTSSLNTMQSGFLPLPPCASTLEGWMCTRWPEAMTCGSAWAVA